MRKQHFYISKDHRFFYSSEIRDMYNDALNAGDEPLKSIKAEKGILLNNTSLYIFRKNDEVVDCEDGELHVYETGPLWNGTSYVKCFCDIDLAKDYQFQSQSICDKYVDYLNGLLPQLTLGAYFGGGHGAALAEIPDWERATEEEVVQIANNLGINDSKYKQ